MIGVVERGTRPLNQSPSMCYVCNRPSHIAKNCRQAKTKSRGDRLTNRQITTEDPPPNIEPEPSNRQVTAEESSVPLGTHQPVNKECLKTLQS